MLTAKLDGDAAVIAAFRALRDEIPRNTVPSALKKAAQWLCAEIQRAAPVGSEGDPHIGQLLANIYVSTRRSAKGSSAGVAVRKTAYYWRFLELGWHSRAGRMFRYEFAGPVIQSSYRDAAQIVINAVGRVVERYQRGGV